MITGNRHRTPLGPICLALFSALLLFGLTGCAPAQKDPVIRPAVFTLDADRFSDYPMGRLHDSTENTDLNQNSSSLMAIGSANIETYRLGAVMVDTFTVVQQDEAEEVISAEQRALQYEVEAYHEECYRQYNEMLRRAEEEAKRKAAEERRRKEEQRKRAAEQAKRAAEEAKRAACPGYNPEYAALLTKEERAEAEYFYEQGYVFFRQNWSYTKDLPYGDEGFGQCGCGPTCLAAIIANLAGVPVTPEDMRVLGLQRGSWLESGGTTYDFILSTAKSYGVTASNLHSSNREAVEAALKAGKLIMVCMGPGDFTLGAHFMLYRGVTDNGEILIADSYSYEYSVKAWKWEDLSAQLKSTNFWVFERES